MRELGKPSEHQTTGENIITIKGINLTKKIIL